MSTRVNDILASFTGTFAGEGFSLRFHPNSEGQKTTDFPNPVLPATAHVDNILELKLTTETLSFSPSLGNHGIAKDTDIILNGVSYTLTVTDVTNIATGKGDGSPVPMHSENGLWGYYPQTASDSSLSESLVRIVSVSQDTKIHAQGLAPGTCIPGPPIIPPVNPTPFVIGTSQLLGAVPIMSQTAGNPWTARVPQDLTKFITAGTITQATLTDPNTVLRNANIGKTINKTISFTVSTSAVTPKQDEVVPGLVPMFATFWIATVQHSIVVPPFKPGQTPLHISPSAPYHGAPVPTFEVNPPVEIRTPTTIVVESTQIQYAQTELFSFSALTWPHISVATLVPTTLQTIPTSAWT